MNELGKLVAVSLAADNEVARLSTLAAQAKATFERVCKLPDSKNLATLVLKTTNVIDAASDIDAYLRAIIRVFHTLAKTNCWSIS